MCDLRLCAAEACRHAQLLRCSLCQQVHLDQPYRVLRYNFSVRCVQEGKQGQTGALSFGQVAEALKRVDAGAAPSDAAAAVSAAAQVTGSGAMKLPWPSLALAIGTVPAPERGDIAYLSLRLLFCSMPASAKFVVQSRKGVCSSALVPAMQTWRHTINALL